MQPKSYCRTSISSGLSTYYQNFAAVRAALKLPKRYTETQFSATLGVPQNGYI